MLSLAILCLSMFHMTCLQPASKDGSPVGPPPPAYGMRLPRPVDATQRAAGGFAAPRDATRVLADIEAIPSRMREGGDDQSKWRAIRIHNEEVKRDRIDLISELEESGFVEARLNELLRQKLLDIRDVWDRAQFPVDTYDRLRKEVVKRHKGEEIAVTAAADSMLEVVHMTTLNGLRIHPDDYGKLADLELKRKDSDLGGLLLLEALAADKDPELRRTWHDWMLQNLGPQAMGKRYVIRQRSFGHPIKLDGEGLDGSKIDTGDWAGEVILVDFWGTWCVPCKEAMPELKRLQDKYQGRGLRVIGVLCDYQLDKAAAWLAEKGFAWPQIVDRSLTRERYDKHRIAVQYAVGGFPTLWIIDRNGVLREEGDRENLEEQVGKFLDEPRRQAK
jgi:thiol-disulfide isomerase/thioredoxin